MTGRLEFTVLGKPQPGGSKKIVTAGGKPGGRPILVDAAARAKPWQALVAAAANDARDGTWMDGPLMLEVDFYFARPAGHYGSGRNHNRLKSSAPPYPAVKPDATKLLRALEDALTGLAWRDDAQVVTQVVRKRYGTPERAEVLVQAVGAGEAPPPAPSPVPPPIPGQRDLFADDGWEP